MKKTFLSRLDSRCGNSSVCSQTASISAQHRFYDSLTPGLPGSAACRFTGPPLPRFNRDLAVLCLTALLLAPALAARAVSATNEFAGATPLQWSIRMADSEMARRGDSLVWKEGGRAKWDYTAGLFTLSLLRLNERVSDPRYVRFAEDVIGSFVNTNGEIHGYKAADFNLDNINPGKTVLALYGLTKESRYRRAAELLRKQLDGQPRTSDGGFWHKQRYPHQMWLDGLYMAEPFYAQYGLLFDEPADFDDVAKQILMVSAHTYDPKTGLFYHGWDESKEQEWANRTTGTSSNFWGRAIGWYGMALVDVLDFFPTNHPARPAIIATLQKLAAGVVKYQDPKSGLWYQVVDQGAREGNYLEATASSMFTYVLAKGVNRGYLSPDYLKPAVKGYRGIIGKLIKVGDRGRVTLTHCCSVAGLGYGRDGSFAYYIKEPVVDNDLKGVGPFILAGMQLQDALGLPSTVSAGAPAAGGEATMVTTSALAAEWAQASNILARIHEPKFPSREFPITDFGAKADGYADCTASIRRAVVACHEAGGGHVIVPPGTFITGPIHLLSGVDLHLDEGSALRFTTNAEAYLPVVFTRFEGMECYNYSPLIYAFGQENIAVTGGGVLDGQADDDNWWRWKGSRTTRNGAPNQNAARRRLVKMVADNVPVSERQFGTGSYLRPNFIQPYRCRNVLIEGVRIRRSPMWEVNPVLCTNVIVRGLDIMSHGPNNDGCDPESSHNVLVENCLFDTGDDCIAIKSGRNNDGRRVGVSSANLVIRDCTMKDGHGGVTIGSEISGGCSNVFVENCQMDSPNLDRVLRLKSNAVRGGIIQNVFLRNVEVGQVADAVLQIDFVYEEGANGPYKPVARNIVMEDVTVKQTPRILNVVGFPAAEISNVRILDSTFLEVQEPDVVRDADVKLIDCKVERQN